MEYNDKEWGYRTMEAVDRYKVMHRDAVIKYLDVRHVVDFSLGYSTKTLTDIIKHLEEEK